MKKRISIFILLPMVLALILTATSGSQAYAAPQEQATPGVVTISELTGENAQFNGTYHLYPGYPLLYLHECTGGVFDTCADMGSGLAVWPAVYASGTVWFIGDFGAGYGGSGPIPFHNLGTGESVAIGDPPPATGWLQVDTNEPAEGLLLTGDVEQPPVVESPDDFVITVKTDNPGYTSDSQYRFFVGWGVNNFNVDCDNDGIDEVSGETGNYYNCDYASPGTYTIRIKDNVGDGTGFTQFIASTGYDPQKLLTVEQWGTFKWTSMHNAFYGATNLTSVPSTEAPDLSNVTDLSGMFRQASKFNTPIGHWDVSNITTMSRMFQGASSFNQDIGGWDTSSATNMHGMFGTVRF